MKPVSDKKAARLAAEGRPLTTFSGKPGKPLQRGKWEPERKPLNRVGRAGKRKAAGDATCRRNVQARDVVCVACRLLISRADYHPRTAERIEAGQHPEEWAHVFGRNVRPDLRQHPAYSLLLCCWHHDDHHQHALKIEAYREGCHQIQVLSDGTHKARRVLTLDGLFTNEETSE